MFCRNCGKDIRDTAAFCPHCGAVNNSAGGTGSSQSSSSYESSQPILSASGGKKRRGTGLILGGIAVAAVAVVAAAAVAVSSLFVSPKGQVEKAMAKTVSAYAEANKKLNLPDLKELSKSRSVSQKFSLELNSINEQLTNGYDLSALKGIGVRMSTDLDQKDRKMDADFTAYWGSRDIISFQMLVEDNTMYFGSPQFLDDTFFGVDTETLGADLADLTDEDEIEDISFNIFDLIDMVVPEDQDEETERAVKKANKALLEAIEVDKDGAETIEVNGKNTKTTAYHVVIPQDALEDYVDAMEDVMNTVDYVDLYRDVLKAMGVPKYAIDEIMYDVGNVDIYGQAADAIKDALDEIGDVELDVYLSGGYVSAVTYSDKIMGTKIEINLYLGGGDQYVDDLTLEIEGDGAEILLESTGNHSGKGGTFTDETTIRVRSGGSTLGRVTSEMSYSTSSSDFQWEIAVESGGSAVGSLEMEGQLTCGKDSMELVLDDITVKAMGIKAVSLSAEYAISPCKGMSVSVGSTEMLTDLDEKDLIKIAFDVQRNAQEWQEDMQSLMMDRGIPLEMLRWALRGY